MSLSTFVKLVVKAFKFTVSRPLQRFNIENRAVKYLGPDAAKYSPAPRAIGPISGLSLRELPRYPGFKSVSGKRADDHLVIEASNKLTVIKTESTPKQIEAGNRPLPKSTDLQLQDLSAIWETTRVPPGRLNLNMLQEIMINKLADPNWTSKAIAEEYNIREEYAEKLIGHLRQFRIRISPRVARNLQLVGMDNPAYQAAKHLIYHVDNSLRSDIDRKFDSMYSPSDNLPDDVREVIDSPGSLQLEQQKQLASARRMRLERPAPLRIAPSNVIKSDSSQPLKLPGAKDQSKENTSLSDATHRKHKTINRIRDEIEKGSV